MTPRLLALWTQWMAAFNWQGPSGGWSRSALVGGEKDCGEFNVSHGEFELLVG